MEILRVENVCKTYDTGETTVNALTDISFSVQKGEFVAIIGASGSGKSTLLHILGGIDRPTSGEVFVDGQSVYERTEDQLAVFRRKAFNRIVAGIGTDKAQKVFAESAVRRAAAARSYWSRAYECSCHTFSG